MHALEEREIEQPQISPRMSEPVGFGPVVAVLACLATGWIAAGSIGLLAHPLRRALELVALGIALLVPGICQTRCRIRMVLTPLVACAAACMILLAVPTANIMAATLVLAFLAVLSEGRNRDALQAGAVTLAVFGLYSFVRTSIPWFWLATDHLGQGMASLLSIPMAKPTHVGATFAGLDFLVVTTVFWALYVGSTKPPRAVRVACGFAAIVAGHLLYLIGLAYVPDLVAAVPEGASSWAGFLHEAVPWNLPIVACAIHLLIAGAMLRWSPGISPGERPQTDVPSLSPGARLALGAAALAMALLLPIVTVLDTSVLSASNKKIVFYEKGFLNWLQPTHDSYGRLSSGMYGMLPMLVESLGARCVISSDLSAADLEDADALVLIFPDEPWSNGQLDRINEFVRRGGSLLVMGEHTTGDPNGNNRFNDVLGTTAMHVRFDSATFAVGGWLHSYETLSHPTTVGIADDRNQFGVVIGASVDTRWPARPLLVGRWGWADQGDEASDRAMMGNGRYDSGEKLGDIVLAAEQPLGKGRVIVFGDTSNLSNGINVSAHAFTSRLLAYLASGRNAHPAWRQFAGALIGAFLIVLLCRRHSPWRTALVAVGLTASLTLCLSANLKTREVMPDGRVRSPNNLAYINASGLSPYSGESWRPDGLGGLALTLMRHDYLPLTLAELTFQRLQRAGLLICGARCREFSEAELHAIDQFVNAGGILLLTVGRDHANASGPLLRRFGFGIGLDETSEPAPWGHFKSPYLEANGRWVYVRFHAAWPIRCEDPNARAIAYGRDNQPVILLRRVGSGQVVLIGDTYFATNQNLEREDGLPFEGLRENADFWRWLIALLRDDEVWMPPALQDGALGDSLEGVTP